MATPLNQLMQKEMTRKEFLLTLGLGVVSIFGFSNIVEIFTGHSIHRNISTHIKQENGTIGSFGVR